MRDKSLLKDFDYEKVPGKYCFMLIQDTPFYYTGIKGLLILHEYFELYPNGKMRIKKGYQWNGSTGALIKNRSTIRCSVYHDAFYQILREGIKRGWLRTVGNPEALNYAIEPNCFAYHQASYISHTEIKEQADKVYYDFAIEDRMWKYRAELHYWVLKRVGSNFCKPVSLRPID